MLLGDMGSVNVSFVANEKKNYNFCSKNYNRLDF